MVMEPFLFPGPGYQQLTACADTSNARIKSRNKKKVLTDEQRACINKRRRELYHEKKQSTKPCDVDRRKSMKQPKTGAEGNQAYK